MDANELGRWTRFAAKGGIGKCFAVHDCVAEEADDLMFLKDDEITVLMQLPGREDLYLGYCEGVVGRFHASSVRFQGRLKKPVMTKRSSTLSTSRPSSSLSTGGHGGRESAHPRHSPSLPIASPTPRSGGPVQQHGTVSLLPMHSGALEATAKTEASQSESLLTMRPAPMSASVTEREPSPVTALSSAFTHTRTASQDSTSTTSFYSPKLSALHDSDTADVGFIALTSGQRMESPSEMADHDNAVGTADGSHTQSTDGSHAPPAIVHAQPLFDEDPEPSSYMSSEPTARFSQISGISDGEVGIGLTMLQNFMGGGGDDSDSELESLENRRQSLSSNKSAEPNGLQNMSLSSESTLERPPDEGEESEDQGPSMSDMSLDFPVPPEAPSPTSIHPSATESEYGGDEWEGASDIYDNYRYSRMSMASKMSRFSKASALSLGVPPPVPTPESRPSMDSIRPLRERLGSSATASSVDSALKTEPAAKRVPAPLTFAPEITSSRSNSQDDQQQQQQGDDHKGMNSTSPLLHTTFGSPLSSPTPISTGGFVAAALTSPIYATATNGAASALRQRLETERGVRSESPAATEDLRGLGISGLTADSRARLSTQPIVMDDDESIPPVSPPSNRSFTVSMTMSPEQRSTSSEPTSPSALANFSSSSLSAVGNRDSTMSSSYLAEKQAMASTFVISNPNPPPPYTPVSPTAESSSARHVQPQPAPPQSQSHPVGVPIARPRPVNANTSQASRTSLFMPHPHAPKPAASPAGPMYGRPPSMEVSMLLAGGRGPPPGSLLHTIQAALSMRYDGMPGSRRPTIYGMTETDLSVAVGPVPIWFSLDPPNNIPAMRMKSPPMPGSPMQRHFSALSPPPGSPRTNGQGQALPRVSADSERGSTEADSEVQEAARKVIPRANFFPKVQTPRPRSRSFSGFDSQVAEIQLPDPHSPVRISHEESKREDLPPVQTLAKRSKSASAMVAAPVNATPQRASVSHTAPTARSLDRKPSPLSLSQNNVVAAGGSVPPKSPLANPPIVAASQPPSPRVVSPTTNGTSFPSSVRPLNIVSKLAVDHTASPGTPKEPSSHLPAEMTHSAGSPPKIERAETLPSPALSSSPPNTNSMRRSRSSLSLRHSRTRSRSSLQGRRSGETDVSDARTNATSPPLFGSPPNGSALGRAGSLRSKLSLPTLRIRSEKTPSHEGGSPRSPTSSLATSEQEQRTVQVKDAEFEIVLPNGPLSPVQSASEDGFGLAPPSPRNPDSLRADSPAISVISSTSASTRARLPLATSPILTPTKPPPSPATAEAYRKRELNWISTISSIPASQSRKSKKVRKLLQDGVPSSVRYLVWAHLTDSKAKRIEGLYTKLGKRERVAASASIERDVLKFVERHPQLQDASLVNLLQAYLTMVPDVQYSPGLVAVAGLILLQSPEEDAFWTFISLMDSHIRPYFSANPIQLDVDASLLVKCLDSVDAALSKKLFVDLGIQPATICRPWFTGLFVDMLPPDHLRRVWDIFLYEGVAFLFRAALAILVSCKQALFSATSQEAVLSILLVPPPSMLPTQPDAFLEVAFSVRMKDDDIRKQRNKMEAQVKRQTQPRVIDVSRPSISLPRS